MGGNRKKEPLRLIRLRTFYQKKSGRKEGSLALASEHSNPLLHRENRKGRGRGGGTAIENFESPHQGGKKGNESREGLTLKHPRIHIFSRLGGKETTEAGGGNKR